MYEVQKHNVILARLLKRIPENEDVRPSSPLYIQSSTTAKEFETVYGELDYTLDQIFPTTQSRAYLIKDAQTYRMAPFAATYAVIEGEFDAPVDIGTRFTKDGIGFTVTTQLDKTTVEHYYYSLTCEEAGEIGNVLSGTLLPDWNIPDLKHAYATRILIPGENEEDTEAFRERYLASFQSKAFGGNLSDYINHVVALDGVGRVKILRCIDFEGNVKPEWVGIVITDSEFHKPSEELVASVQESIQPLGVTGLPELETSGLGIAPISHLAYVKGVNEETINISLSLTYVSGYSWDRLKSEIEDVIQEYLDDLCQAWGDITASQDARNPTGTFLSVSRAQIESRLLDIDGIIDANDTVINEEPKNYNLQWDSIPVLGELTESDGIIIDKVNCSYNCPDCPYDKNAAICERVQGVLNG